MSNDGPIHPFLAAKTLEELISVKTKVHDQLWGAVRMAIATAIERGETELSRVVRVVEAVWREMDDSPSNGTAFGGPVTLPRAALIGGRQALRMRSLAAACLKDTDLVLELGCGWGLNLADFYLGGGPRDASYFGLDLSSEGVECLRLLATLRGGPAHFYGGKFNMMEPEYSMLPHCSGHLLVFSFHAIEQVQNLREEVITGLFEISERVTGVHHEPVGWQIRESLGIQQASSGATRENSARSAYNENLWRILSDLESRGEIRITKRIPDIFGHKNKNASSLIVWERS